MFWSLSQTLDHIDRSTHEIVSTSQWMAEDGRVRAGCPSWNIFLILQRSWFWTTACILDGGWEDEVKILGKNLDCYPGWDMSSRKNTGKFGAAGLEREWMREKRGKRERDKGDFDSSNSLGQNVRSKVVSLFQENVGENENPSLLYQILHSFMEWL